MRADKGEESGNYTPFPPDRYLLRVLEEKSGMTKESHRVKTDLTLEVDEGPYKGRKMWTTWTAIPAGEPGHGLTVQALHAFGLEYDGDLDFDTADFVDRVCEASVEIQAYTDNKGNPRKKNAIPAGGYITESSKESATAAPPKAAAPPPAKAAATRPEEEDLESCPF